MPPLEPKHNYTVLVVGPAYGHDEVTVRRTLDRRDVRECITGILTTTGTGVCEWTVDWAEDNGVDYALFHTRDDGEDAFMRAILRNSRMLAARPSFVLAFEGRIGTRWLVATADRSGIPTRSVAIMR